MQLNSFTDFALRTLIYLAIKDGKSTIAEIAGNYGISESHLVKVVHHLAKHGYVKTIRGKGGGLMLALAPDAINLGALVQCTEPNFNLVECFDLAKNTCTLQPACKLKGVLHKAQKQFLDTLSEYSLADIISNKEQLIELIDK